MHDSILSFKRQRYLWVAFLLCLASLIAYFWHQPVGAPPNGGTWLGYTLGGIGAALILWLLWFGIRKRRYRSGVGTLRGWLSAHVYLGSSLILIALLHSGFQVGWNVHTLALTLMLLVIFSGFFGVFAYLRYPALMTRNRDNATRDAMIEEIAELDQAALQLADAVDPAIHAIVLRSIERTVLGGGVWAQLTARDGSAEALENLRQAASSKEKGGDKAAPAANRGQTMIVMVDFLAGQTKSDKQSENLRKLIDLMTRKKVLAERVARDIQLQALMEIWLYVHVPLSIALLGALIAHVVSVLFYW